MRVVPSDDPGHEPGMPDHEHEPGDGHDRLDAMRSWLAGGVHLVDRRRRFGRHGRARELLVVERKENGGSERWQSFAAALHRHTVRGGLAELKPEERHVITLAYLEGRTNREIAATLGVSVTTARRRLWAALKRLDDYINMTGVWLTALVVAAGAYVSTRAVRLGRYVDVAAGSPEKAQRLAATITAGVVTTAALGVVAFSSDSAAPSRAAPAATARLNVQTSAAELPSAPIGSVTVGPESVKNVEVTLAGTPASVLAHITKPVTTVVAGNSNGCQDNPTSAAPTVPVGARGSHPVAPVTHPSAGGCKALPG